MNKFKVGDTVRYSACTSLAGQERTVKHVASLDPTVTLTDTAGRETWDFVKYLELVKSAAPDPRDEQTKILLDDTSYLRERLRASAVECDKLSAKVDAAKDGNRMLNERAKQLEAALRSTERVLEQERIARASAYNTLQLEACIAVAELARTKDKLERVMYERDEMRDTIQAVEVDGTLYLRVDLIDPKLYPRGDVPTTVMETPNPAPGSFAFRLADKPSIPFFSIGDKVKHPTHGEGEINDFDRHYSRSGLVRVDFGERLYPVWCHTDDLTRIP